MTNWRYINEKDVTAAYGLAVDEYLLNPESINHNITLRLYTYRDYCALAGRFQDIEAEIDIDKCKTEHFEIGRRLTGGGAIIMGQGQLGICIAVLPNTMQWTSIRELYIKFSEPIILALEQLGIKASFQAKNDIEVKGKKIAGTGVHIAPNGAIQFHTSLLLDFDILNMLKVLKIPIQKYDDKLKIRSVKQRMTTINDQREDKLAMEELKKVVCAKIESCFNIVLKSDVFSETEQKEIKTIQTNKYESDAWIYQYSPREDMTGMSLVKTPAGLLRTYISLNENMIKSVMITGDFFNLAPLFTYIEQQLKWSPFDIENIQPIVEKGIKKFPDVKHNISVDNIVKAIMLSGNRASALHRYSYQGSCYYPDKKPAFEN